MTGRSRLPARDREPVAPTKDATPARTEASETPESLHAQPTVRLAPPAAGPPDPATQAALLHDATGGRLDRAGAALLRLQRDLGNRHVQEVIGHAHGGGAAAGAGPAPAIQAKLKVGPPGDRFEREADRVAQRLTGRTATGDPPDRDGSAAGPAHEDLETSVRRATGGGERLPSRVASSMQEAFGADFSGVRLHRDAESDALNRSLSARAFTVGDHIFFRRGDDPGGRAAGLHLLAHELTHVVQQRGQAVPPGGGPDGRHAVERGSTPRDTIQRTGDGRGRKRRRSTTEESDEPPRKRLKRVVSSVESFATFLGEVWRRRRDIRSRRRLEDQIYNMYMRSESTPSHRITTERYKNKLDELKDRFVGEGGTITRPGGFVGLSSNTPKDARKSLFRIVVHPKPDAIITMLRYWRHKVLNHKNVKLAKVPPKLKSAKGRADPIVVYLVESDTGESRSDLAAVADGLIGGFSAWLEENELLDGLESGVPPMVEEVEPGIGFAEQPPRQAKGKSFGEYRSEVIAKSLRDARDWHQFRRHVRDDFRRAELDFDAPHRNTRRLGFHRGGRRYVPRGRGYSRGGRRHVPRRRGYSRR